VTIAVAATAPLGADVLERLAAEHEIAFLLTRPDAPRGRGRRLAPPPAKEAATRRGIPVLQPERPELPDEPVALTFAVSAALEGDGGEKRKLLATRSTDERVALLLHLLPVLTRSLESAVRVHRRARRNGKGDIHSVLPADS